MTAVLLIGSRDGALAAAERLGLDVYLVSETKPLRQRRPRLAGLCVTSFEQRRPAFIQTVASAFPNLFEAGAAPRAIAALTERSVIPAAWLREQLQVRGNDVDVAARCRDKLHMKEHAKKYGVPCADFSPIDARTTPVQLAKRLGLPLVLKPRDASGARGTTFVRALSDIPTRLGSNLMAESLVHGLEMSVETLIVDGDVRFVNLTEYLLPLWANVVPAALLPEAERQVRALNLELVRSLGVQRGMTHVELFLTTSGPVFSEIALRPPGGLLMRLLQESYGFDPWEAVLRCELGEPVELPQSSEAYSGVWFIHPGPGRVTRLQGLGVAERVAGVEEINCRARVGDEISARGGSGESTGHVLARGATRAEVVGSLERARRSIVIELEALSARRRVARS
ncbi:MAG TPA: ATP-grasp domain-containing protein [Polyangiaceae bacterium]|nr:ATP-grasp domain-containing protein [Polyangiaceae bacterium]